MNPKISTLLRKTFFLLGAVTLGWAAQAQTADSTQKHRSFGPRAHNFGQAQGQHNFGNRGGRNFGGARAFSRGEFVRYSPEQRQQIAAINKEYHQKSEALFNKDNSTLREYKAGLLALQKEKKTKLDAVLTQKQKDERTARLKRMTENTQVMAAARLERLKLHLNLTDDQVTKIKAGQQDLHNQLKAIHENDNLLPQQKMEQMKNLMAKRNDTYKSVLTPEQYSQFEKMSHHRDGFDGRRGPDGRSRMGRPGSEGRPEWQNRS